MKWKSLLSTLLISSLFVGCGAERKQVSPTAFIVDDEEDTTEDEVVTNGVMIHGMKGAYPESYKGKILGQGLFDHVYFNIAKRIIANVENIDKAIVISIYTKSSKPDVRAVVEEGKKFFKLHKDFKLASGVRAADVKIKVEEDESLKFITMYENSDIFENDSDQIDDMAMSITEMADESNSFWSTIYITDNNGNKVKYQIMKDAVTVSQYNPKKLGNKPVTNISFSKADDFCFNKYQGYVAPLYVFEYALRKGAILPPAKGVSAEMISGYDDANDADVALHRDTDIVTSDDESDGDFSEIVVFNYKAKNYKFKRDNFVSKSVTFRCAK